MYEAQDPKIVATMAAIKNRLWVKTAVGGIARYEDDKYHQISRAIEKVPGNPWFITTLWYAEWLVKTARNSEDIAKALDLIEWILDHALPSGVLAEQVNPYNNKPLSVSPLTWSHAAFVSTIQTFLQENERVNAF
jgi:GH15 family glucan-1,4-alpha-glucosidase